MRFYITTEVDQIVTKEIRLVVEASSEEEATSKAREALQDYPQAVAVKGVNKIVTVSSKYWIPRSIEFKKIVEEGAPVSAA